MRRRLNNWINSDDDFHEKFIREIKPKPDTPTSLDQGLHATDELLNSVTGTKEIIIISDGFLDPKGLTQTKNTVLELQNRETKIQFIQIVPPKEQCSAKAYDTTTVTITEASGKGNPIEGAEVSFDGTIIGITNNTGKIDYMFISSGLHNITATKPRYETFVKMVQVLPAPNITLNPTAIINQTPNTDLLLKNEVKEVEEPLNKIEGFENKSSWLESTIRSIDGWFKSIF